MNPKNLFKIFNSIGYYIKRLNKAKKGDRERIRNCLRKELLY